MIATIGVNSLLWLLLQPTTGVNSLLWLLLQPMIGVNSLLWLLLQPTIGVNSLGLKTKVCLAHHIGCANVVHFLFLEWLAHI